MIGTWFDNIVNSIQITISVTPLNMNFSDDSGGNQKTDNVKNTTTINGSKLTIRFSISHVNELQIHANNDNNGIL